MSYITSRTQKLSVYNIYFRWMIMGMAVTHVEVDNPQSFNSYYASPSLIIIVYRASAIGLATLLAGWALHKYTRNPPAAERSIIIS